MGSIVKVVLIARVKYSDSIAGLLSGAHGREFLSLAARSMGSVGASPALRDAIQVGAIVLAIILILIVVWLILRRKHKYGEGYASAEPPANEEYPPVTSAPEEAPEVPIASPEDLKKVTGHAEVGRRPGGTGPWPSREGKAADVEEEPEVLLYEPTPKWEEQPRPQPPPAEEAPPQPPAPRYADFTFFHRDGAGGEVRLPRGYALQSQHTYVLEVAVRGKLTGIPATGVSHEPILEPRSKAEVDIWVTLETEPDFLEVEEPVQILSLPPVGDSEKNARFVLHPLRPSTGSGDLADIRIRLFYEFNLIEVGIIRAEVAEQFGDPSRSRFGLESPISFVQERLERELLDVDSIRPRAMHIDVTKGRAGYVFHFTLFNAAEQKVVFSAPVPLTREDLEDALVTTRDLLYDIALSDTFSRQLEGREEERAAALRKLAETGRRLWVTLFRREVGSAIFDVGRWLQMYPLEPDSLIQISLDRDASDVVFPWALLYDRELPHESHEPPDVDGFWGVRYVIEQHIPGGLRGPDTPIDVGDRLDLLFVLWPFGNSKEQETLISDFVERSKGRLVATAPITNAETCRRQLTDCRAQILYFYTHGHTRRRRADLASGPGLDAFVERYERLPADSPTREAFRFLYENVRGENFEPERSWIALEYGKLYLDEMYDQIGRFHPKRPLVVLNMCESAQMVPSLSESFVRFFLDRGAVAVLGTECPMTVEFAHPFGAAFLEATLSGDGLGAALLKARRRFMKVRNPLGLAYSLYGNASVSFQPPRLT